MHMVITTIMVATEIMGIKMEIKKDTPTIISRSPINTQVDVANITKTMTEEEGVMIEDLKAVIKAGKAVLIRIPHAIKE